jgi:putative oxidoreductase
VESIDFGLLALRLLVGGVFVGHAVVKFTTRFGGLGPDRAGAVFERIGYRPPRPYLVIAGATELVAGIAFLAGLATPLAAAALVGVLVNTIGSSKAGHGPWYFNGGWEYDVTLLVVAVALAFTGPGDASLDAAAGLDAAGWAWGTGALALGVASGRAVLAMRQRVARSTTAGGVVA